jgi:hypothetical protein
MRTKESIPEPNECRITNDSQTTALSESSLVVEVPKRQSVAWLYFNKKDVIMRNELEFLKCNHSKCRKKYRVIPQQRKIWLVMSSMLNIVLVHYKIYK